MACSLRAAPAPVALPELLAMQNTVDEFRLEGSSVWFTLALDPDRYYLRFADPATVLPILQNLEASQTTNRAVKLKFRLAGAYIDANGLPTYSVESFEYDGRSWSGFRRHERPKDLASTPAELALARGIGLARGDQSEAGLRELDASLEANSLRDALLPLALRTRANVLDDLAYADNWQINERDDALLVQALDDMRAVVTLEPSNVENLYMLAYLYRTLGALPEAFTTYETVEKRFPDEDYRVAVRRGATHRQAGDYRAALKSIDDFVDKAGPQRGMMLHYHRAMTLNLLKRHSEAVSEINIGLEGQPDYTWAFDERACGWGSQGKIAEALADEKQALALFLSVDPSQRASRISAAQLKRFEALVTELDKASRDAPTKPIQSPCDSAYADPAEYRRERSALLPKN
jgi:tetratricopeptide (TPR) repeat protein